MISQNKAIMGWSPVQPIVIKRNIAACCRLKKILHCIIFIRDKKIKKNM